jgi:methionine-S-sulfoxide reductase
MTLENLYANHETMTSDTLTVSVSTEPLKKAIFAAGCFWGVEELIRKVPGVVHTTVGYTGGITANPTYPEVKTGKTGHAEAIEIEFNDSILSYDELLNCFFRLHDPTTPNCQGNDIGSQYRSAIFFFDEAQRLTAEKKKAEVEAQKKWKNPICTEIVPVTVFYSAEDYHQDYIVKNPAGYNCHFWRD